VGLGRCVSQPNRPPRTSELFDRLGRGSRSCQQQLEKRVSLTPGALRGQVRGFDRPDEEAVHQRDERRGDAIGVDPGRELTPHERLLEDEPRERDHLGMAIAVLIDATIIRALLVPATMRLLGRWAWWSPTLMVGVTRQLGFSHVEGTADCDANPVRA
jgi:hypothetical protein